MQGLVKFTRRIMAPFLVDPAIKCFLRLGKSNGIFIDHDPGIRSVGHHADKKVVIAAGHMVDR